MIHKFYEQKIKQKTQCPSAHLKNATLKMIQKQITVYEKYVIPLFDHRSHTLLIPFLVYCKTFFFAAGEFYWDVIMWYEIAECF